MHKEEYKIEFILPGFLGDAEQKSMWRTPPFKALIQYWWRVAVAKEHGYDWQKIREREGRLFGHAWLKDEKGKDWAMRSRVRIRLEQCKSGQLQNWEGKDPKIKHPEVKFPVGSQLYLGYGPLAYKKGTGISLKTSPAIGEHEENQLTLIYPEQEMVAFKHTMQLIHWFGTLGGRSRNGWGSIVLFNEALINHDMFLGGKADISNFQRPLADCLREEWPHAIGSDADGVLIWKTQPCGSWQDVMKKLAEIKIGYRTSLNVSKPFDERQVLALPVTHHTPWDLKNERVANQIRFKVLFQQGKYYGLVFHLPCRFPNQLSDKLPDTGAQTILANQENIWRKVHKYLDNNMKRTGSQ